MFSFFRRDRGTPGLPTDPVDQVYALVARGRTIQAIKVVRRETGWDLRRAKDVVERIAAGQPVPELDDHPAGAIAPAPPSANVPAVSAEALDRIRSLLARGKKIQAVQEFRTASGWGLKESKLAVERLESGQPAAPGSVPVPDAGERVRALVAAGRHIEAIKELRAATGCGINQATGTIDRIAAGDTIPELPRGSLADRTRAMRANLGRDAAVALVARETGMTPQEAEHFVDAL